MSGRYGSKQGTTTYTYDGASNVGTVTYPNGVAGTYMYDALNRVTGLDYSNQANSYVYTRNTTGQLASASEPNGRQVAWSFDGIYRLTNEQITGDPNSQNNGTVSYTGLDPVGNRLSDTSSPAGVPSGSWNYNADDELSDETYDQDGNVTTADGKTFSYDSQNELVAMNGGAVGIAYDGDGNRVAKTVTAGGVTTTTQYLVDDLNPTGLPQVMDELTNGVVTRTYTYGLQRISEDQLVSSAWTPSFYSYDGMGSVRQLTNTAGAVTDTYEYDAFGNQISHTGSTPNNYLYRGEQWDSDLGLYYLRARFYNPMTDRFVSRDPDDGDLTDPATLHKYLYASGDPVNLKDPTGRQALAATAEIDFNVAFRSAVAATAITVGALCLLHATATGIEGVTENLGYTMKIYPSGPCTLEVKSCKTEFPDLIPVSQLPGDYEFGSEGEAFISLQQQESPQQLRKGKRATATSGPCPAEGPWTPGWHVNVRYASGKRYAGSLVGCPVCDDSSGEPIESERWATK